MIDSMRRIVKLNHPLYGKVELNIDKVIAVVPEKHQLLFEAVRWDLAPEEFAKVYEVWQRI